jgi:hypothetical protein
MSVADPLLPIVHSILKRHVPGAPLFTANIRDDEVESLRRALTAVVARRGVAGLGTDSMVTTAFAAFASSFLAVTASELAWAPVLSALGATESDVEAYPQLYEPLEKALQQRQRTVLTRLGRRRFLGTLLREGGLPLRIGCASRATWTPKSR